MKACYYDSWGTADKVLKLGQVPVPKLVAVTDVLVKIHAASINPADYKQCEGGMKAIVYRPFPILPGFDFSGVIIEKGTAVGDRLQVGDEVFGMIRGLRTGTTAEFILVDEHVVSKKPAEITHLQAAGVPLAAITAFQCLLKAGLKYPPSADSGSKSVFLTGGPGGVGTFLIQMAKVMFKVGRVVTTASAGKVELCKSLGADEVIDYKTQKFWEALKTEKFDVCVDCSGETSQMVNLVKPGGGLSTILTNITGEMLREWLAALGPNPGIVPAAPVKHGINRIPTSVLNVFTGAWWIHHRLPSGASFHSVITIPGHDTLDLMIDYLKSGKIKVVIDHVYPLDEALKAYEHSMSGKAVGKVIVQVV